MSLSQIHNGRLQYKFDCGSGPGIVSVQSIQVNDGLWHAVSLEVNGNYARLVLDQVHTASGTAPGTLKTLNLDSHVYFGGHVRQQGSRHGRSPQVGNGFRGCMDSIYLNGQELPLNNRPRSYAHIEESVDVSPGCSVHRLPTQDPTSSGLLHQPSPAGIAGGPETALDTSQVARWVLELPPGMIRATHKHLTVLTFLSCITLTVRQPRGPGRGSYSLLAGEDGGSEEGK